MAPWDSAAGGGFNLVYFDQWHDPAGLAILEAEPRIRLVRLTREDAPERMAAALAAAHGYQIASSRSEAVVLADRALVERAPDLVAVAARGAGVDTIDVAALSAAGVIVVNQAGANREAVAEHVVGMMLALSKRMIAADR